VPKTYDGRKPPLQQMLLRKQDIACKKWKLHPFLLFCTSINSKWIKDLHIRPETLKLLLERAQNTLEAIDIGKDFLKYKSSSSATKRKVNKWGYMKLKSFCTT
jgi:hypothetical protein